MKTATKQVYDLATAIDVAQEMLELLWPVCHRVEVAGSVRRHCKTVHDIDLVVWPSIELMPVSQLGLFGELHPIEYPGALFELAENQGWGSWKPGDYPKIIHIKGTVPIEIYVCELDGSNFEALWQMRTGSAEFNQMLARKAISLGLYYRAGYGIFRGRDSMERVDDGSEAGIFKALGLEYLPATKRS